MSLAFQSVVAVIILQAGMIVFPGSDWFLVLRQSSEKGPRNGSMVAVGLGLGALFVTLLAILGLNSLFVVYPGVVTVIRYLGVLWFVYQAFITFFPKSYSLKYVGKRAVSPLLSGFINHTANIEMVLFYIAVFSQLAKSANYSLQIATAVEMAGFTTLWFIFIAHASQKVKIIEKVLAHPAARIIIGVLFLLSAYTLYKAG